MGSSKMGEDMAGILNLIAALATWKARLALAAVCAAGAIAVWTSTVHKIEARGADKLVLASKAEGKKANEKNDAVRARASKPGAADRMRNAFCRDCE